LIAKIMQKQAHPVLAQIVNPDVRDDLPISEFAAASSTSGSNHPRKKPNLMNYEHSVTLNNQQPCCHGALGCANCYGARRIGGCLEACFEACRQAHPVRLFVLLQVRMVERNCYFH